MVVHLKAFLSIGLIFVAAHVSGCSSSAQREDLETSESSSARAPSQHLLLSWPVRPPFRLTQKFNRFPSDPHDGIDLGGARNSPILAAHDGWISYVGRDFKGYGVLVIVDSGRGWSTLYSHLNRASVKVRSRVLRGEKVGEMGATGNARGVHLHFELRKEKVPIDPLIYLPSLESATQKARVSPISEGDPSSAERVSRS